MSSGIRRVTASQLVVVDTDRALRVLLVDNDAGEAQHSEADLRARFGDRLAVVHVASLAQAIRSLMEMPFDAVVLELAVGDASGMATLAGVRGAAPTVPVVIFARFLDEALALRALRAGAQECLAKENTPPDALARTLSYAIERQRRLTTLEAAHNDAAHRATHDPLTGLANRELFLAQLERALAFGARYARKTGLLFVDLDGFKEINDTLGHAKGDVLLRGVSRRLLQCVRRSDAVGRLGGDEFVLLLPDVTSRRDVAYVRDTILDCLQAPLDLGDGQALVVRASIGEAMSPIDGMNAEELLAAADAAMYRDKFDRRGAFTSAPMLGLPTVAQLAESFAPSAEQSVPQRRESRLRLALTNGEFEVHYQPILHVISEQLIAAEALLRWRDPDHGLMTPKSFLSLAEDTGLIVPIGELVLHAACTAVVGWRTNAGAQDIRVSVNLSGVQLREKGFDRRVAAILKDTGCPGDALVLELSESSALQDGDGTVETLRDLKALGLRIVVDDFGVGRTSMTFLRTAPVDGIKIDRRFISQMLVDQRDLAIVASLSWLAQGLGISLIAEGVESAEQSQRLVRLQCFEQQGFYFSDALPESELTALLNATRLSDLDARSWRSARALGAVGG